MSDLIPELASDARRSALDRVRAKFPTAVIAVLVAGRWPELGPGKARLAEFVAQATYGRRMAKADLGGTRGCRFIRAFPGYQHKRAAKQPNREQVT